LNACDNNKQIREKSAGTGVPELPALRIATRRKKIGSISDNALCKTDALTTTLWKHLRHTLARS
jgi:hypothetical protein